MLTILRVAVPVPLHGCFDYFPPADLADLSAISPGVRVAVNFGRKQLIGCLLEIVSESAVPLEKIRPASAILDGQPLLGADDLKVLLWASRYYHHPLGEVIMGAFPVRLRAQLAGREKNNEGYCLAAGLKPEDWASLSGKAPRQFALLELLLGVEAISQAELSDSLEWAWRPAMKALLEKGLAQSCKVSMGAAAAPEAPVATPLQLNPSQQAVVDYFQGVADQYSVTLLEGVTGSGKTEVYLHLIQQQLDAGRQVLVLLPEIALTPQLENRFRQRLAAGMGCYHSGLTESVRADVWQGLQSGRLDVVLGTRSAAFIPMHRPGMIILDEEHDPSFRQQEGFRFHARDVAIVRARELDIPVLLGTATPSFESLHNAMQKRYSYHHLSRRAGNAVPPELQLLDLRNQYLQAGLAPRLISSIRDTLARSEQVILFLNRRGYAPSLICHACGWLASCQRCDANMVLHRDREDILQCHHCGATARPPEQCEDCQSTDLRQLGQGTQKLQNAVSELFPDTEVLRLDRDSTRRKGALSDYLDLINTGKPLIILGTQMLAKGHHFPNVTLVGIVDADAGLFSTDFRAPERMAQLIVQVAGRAGRENKRGKVLIQTRHPENPMLNVLLRQGYGEFARLGLQEREEACLPPFTYQGLIRASALDQDKPQIFLQQVMEAGMAMADERIELLGPVPCSFARLSGRYRYQILVQCAQRRPMHLFLHQLEHLIAQLPVSRDVRWSLEIDPLDFA